MNTLAAEHFAAPWWVIFAVAVGVMMVVNRTRARRCESSACRRFGWLWIVLLIAFPAIIGANYFVRRAVNEPPTPGHSANQLDELGAELDALRQKRIELEQADHSDLTLIADESIALPAEPAHAELQPAPRPQHAEHAPRAELAPVAPPVQPVPAAPASAPPVYVADSASYASPAWLEVDGVFLSADIYPSPAAAARGLAGQVAELAPEILEPGESFRILALRSDDPTLAAPFLDTAARQSPDISTRIVESGADTLDEQDGDVLAHLTLEHTETGAGRVVLQLFGPAGDRTRFAAWIEKPWVDSFAAFQSARPGDYLVAHSPTPALSADEARALALDSAASQLTERLAAQLAAAGNDPDTDALYHLVRDALNQNAGIRDRFVQRFNRPDGDVHRALLLVDASDEAYRSIPDLYRATVTSHRASLAWQVGSAAVLLIVIIGLYVLLNFATKGYYEGVLRLAGVALVAAVIFALVLLLG